MGPEKTIDYSLLQSVSSVEDFLRKNFNCSSNKLKMYFEKRFLSRSFKEHSTLSLPLNFVNDGQINPDYEGPAIQVLYEDEIFLVLDKPDNLFVHPLVYDEKNNCLSFLRKYNYKVLNVNVDNYDRGLLYRLDFETSGVLVYVKNDYAYKYLRENFKKIAKKKLYLCRVEGHCKLDGYFAHYFSSKEARGKRVIVSNNEDAGLKGELSLTSKEFDPETNTSLVEVELKTGLRHQIRAQLSHLGFPIRGDEFYGGKLASRLYLHAFKYDLTYEEKTYLFQNIPLNFNGL